MSLDIDDWVEFVHEDAAIFQWSDCLFHTQSHFIVFEYGQTLKTACSKFIHVLHVPLDSNSKSPRCLRCEQLQSRFALYGEA